MALAFSPEAKQKIAALLARYPNTQAACLPVLHLAQEEFGFIPDEAVQLVADTLKIPAAHVWGVTTFYTMYHRKPTGRHTLMMCTNVSCMLRGAYDVLSTLEKSLGCKRGETTADGEFTLIEEECLAACADAPAMIAGQRYFLNLKPADVPAALDEIRRMPADHRAAPPGDAADDAEANLVAVSLAAMPKIVLRNMGVEGANLIDGAIKRGAYATLPKGLAMPPATIVDEVKRSNLRGRGGAGFPTGMKWGFIPKDAKTVYLVINADESEPGTCKDREILFWDPHLLIEGAILSSYALGCAHAYIYIRGEMIREHAVLQRAVDDAYAKGYLGRELDTARGRYKLELTVHRGAGAYICGEETSLLNSLEGKRGWPRLKPPFPAIKGLFGQPTIVNNVETIANIPAILDQGGEWFAKLGTPRSGGTRILCMSGHLNKPGVFELPMGIPLREVIEKVCGGVPGGKRVKAVIPGGSSMPPLDGSELDVPMEFDALMSDERIKPVEVRPGIRFDMGGGKVLRTMAGSGGVIVMDEDTDLVAVCWRIMKFYAHESCGQCTPCREGTGWLARVTERLARNEGRPGDVDLCASIAHGIANNTICALGDAAAWPMLGFLTKFRSEFEARIKPGLKPEPPPRPAPDLVPLGRRDTHA